MEIKKSYSFSCIVVLSLVLSSLFVSNVSASDIDISDGTNLSFYAVMGSDSYFEITVNDNPSLPDEVNGWCVQTSALMTLKTNHSGKMYLFNSPNITGYFLNIGIDTLRKVNYLLNHKLDIFNAVDCTASKQDLQDVIWNLTCGKAYDELSTCSQSIISYLSEIGEDILEFDPYSGSIIVVVVDTYETDEYSVQKIIFELPLDTQNEPNEPTEPNMTSPGHSTGNSPPTADGSKNAPYTGYINEEIIFDGSKSYDYNGWIVDWNWSFGDGSTGSGEIVSHSYQHTGSYKVYLNVTDNAGSKDSYITYAQIVSANHPPTVPTVTGETICDEGVSYDYSFLSKDMDNDTIRYIVDFGVATESFTSDFVLNNTAVTRSHLWESPGIYNVEAYAEDEMNGVSDPVKTMIFVDVSVYTVDDAIKGYFMDYSKDGSIDAFYDEDSEESTPLQQGQDGWYLLDIDDDGIFDYQYHLTEGFKSYEAAVQTEQSNIFMDNILYIIIIAIIGLIVLFLFVFKIELK